jgi:four helix bundle protein
MEETKNPIKSFTDLIVWQKAVELFQQSTADVEVFPDGRTAAIVADQMMRSAGAIGANIAEGFGRSGPNAYRYRLSAAKGCACAAQDWYYKLARLGYLPEAQANQRIALLTEITKMLGSLIYKLGDREKTAKQ